MNSMTGKISFALTIDQKEHFLEYGYLRLTDCFSREKAASWTDDIRTRSGSSPTDKLTLVSEYLTMPPHKSELIRTFAPNAWAAICELLGGEDRIVEAPATSNGKLVVSLSSGRLNGKFLHHNQLSGRHVSGDFFAHFLDSPGAALLVISLFDGIREHPCGIIVYPDSTAAVAKHLYGHPEGASPSIVPLGQPHHQESLEFCNSIIKGCSKFHGLTDQAGDVSLIHPLLGHSASVKDLMIPAAMATTRASLKEPFNFDTEDRGGGSYSMVELRTLQSLEKDRARGGEITSERETVVPEKLKTEEEMKVLELRRLQEALASIDSTNGICCLGKSS